MPLSTAPFSRGQAARKAFCYCGTVGFDMEIFVTIELVLLMLYMKIYCHHLSWQGWDTARTGSVEVGMQKGTQPEEITKKEQRKRYFLELVAQTSPVLWRALSLTSPPLCLFCL